MTTVDDPQLAANPAPPDLAAMLAALLGMDYEIRFAYDAATGYLADLAGPLGSQSVGIGDSPAAALVSVWPLHDELPTAADICAPSVPPLDAGPFESEHEVRELPEVRAIYAAMHASRGRGVMEASGHQLLEAACTAAGVELGAYDHRILTWLAQFEPQTCAVVAGLITRASGAGGASLSPADMQVIRQALADAAAWRTWRGGSDRAGDIDAAAACEELLCRLVTGGAR